MLVDQPTKLPDQTSPERARVIRSARTGGSVITLSNGAEVELTGITGYCFYPPNYLEDLRAGRFT